MKYQFAKKNILVTGGAGFIGSHLCDALIQENNVICLDSLVGGGGNVNNIQHLLQNPNFRFIKQDINQSFDLEQFSELREFKIKIQGIQEIYHLACPTTAKNFDKFRGETLKANSLGIMNILELAKKYKAKILFTSSAVVYGARQKNNPYFKETDSGVVNFISPRACYDEGKRFAETAMITYKEVDGLDTKIVRIFRAYGPRLALFDGQMIPDFVLQALNNKPLIIYGDETFSSSICYVSDIVEGIVAMMSSGEHGPINLGHPEEYKLADLARKIVAMTGSKSEIVFKKPLLFMTPLGLPDISLAKEKLNWFPVVSVEMGLKELVNYVQINRRLLQPMAEKYNQE